MTALRFTKWGGSLHWHYDLEPIGADEHGLWFGARAGITVRRGDEEPVRQPHDFVTLIPVTGCWIASFNPAGAGTDVALYIDVTDRPSIEGGVIHAVDLDLDLIRLFDGSVRILDEDEFDEHRIRYGYPPEVVEQARATTAELFGRLTAGTQPFEVAAATHLAAYTAPSRRP